MGRSHCQKHLQYLDLKLVWVKGPQLRLEGFEELPMDGLTPHKGCSFRAPVTQLYALAGSAGPAHSFTAGKLRPKSKGGAAQGPQFLLAEAWP